MNNHNDTKDGFLGRRFKTCDGCGELITSDAQECRFCGRRFVADSGESERRKYISSQDYQQTTAELEFRKDKPKEEVAAQISLGSPGIFRTASGDPIPPEYGPDFNPKAFSWSALLFPELWHAEKGLADRAIIHFWIRMGTLIVAAFAIILMSFEKTIGFGALLAIPWFMGLAASGAIGFVDARTAHERYASLYRDAVKAGNYERIRAGAIRLYWLVLLIPFCVFIIAFLISIMKGAAPKGFN